jgi:recombination protein RecR
MIRDLREALQAVGERVRCCAKCGGVTSVDDEPCRLCTSPTRDPDVLCVVEEPGDILMIESSGAFHGRYHALMGKLSPMRGAGPADLRMEALLARVRGEEFKEVILALSTDVEGDATAGYLSETLGREGVKVSRLAFGLPAGSGIAYSDPVTLGRAINGRRET